LRGGALVKIASKAAIASSIPACASGDSGGSGPDISVVMSFQYSSSLHTLDRTTLAATGLSAASIAASISGGNGIYASILDRVMQ